MRKRPTAAIVTGVVAVAIIVGQLATTAAATNGRLAGGSLTGTWSGTYSGAYHGTFTLHWTQSKSRLTGTINLSSVGRTNITGNVRGSTISFGTVGNATGDHLLGLGIRQVDVGHLQDGWRRRLVEARTRRDSGGRTRESLRGRQRVEGSRELGARADPELAVRTAEIRLDGLARHEHLGRDRIVRQPGRGEVRDPKLGRRELARRRPGSGPPHLLPSARRPGCTAELLEQRRCLLECSRAPAASSCRGEALVPARAVCARARTASGSVHARRAPARAAPRPAPTRLPRRAGAHDSARSRQGSMESASARHFASNSATSASARSRSAAPRAASTASPSSRHTAGSRNPVSASASTAAASATASVATYAAVAPPDSPSRRRARRPRPRAAACRAGLRAVAAIYGDGRQRRRQILRLLRPHTTVLSRQARRGQTGRLGET